MCDIENSDTRKKVGVKTIPVDEAIGTVLAHDITEIRKEDFKGRAFKKGHIIRKEDIGHLVLSIAEDEVHENDAACAVAEALMGAGVRIKGEPKEGKITLIAERDGLLKVDREALFQFNMLGEVMCATLHDNMIVKEGQTIAGTRAIPLVVKRDIVKDAVAIAEGAGKVISVKELRRPKAGIVITGNEVYYGRIKDAFAPIITKKLQAYGGEVVGTYYAPDDETFIEERLKELIDAGADLLITTGGMSVDPDDVTRFAIRRLGAGEISYGSPVLPGAMFLVAYLLKSEVRSMNAEVRINSKEENLVSGQCAEESEMIPVLGIPACGMYSNITIFDMILPRVLAGERIGRRQLAELGHGGLCLKCDTCRYPVCPFGKQ
jgi:molybdenum cofactor synthesis domain-containing protein